MDYTIGAIAFAILGMWFFDVNTKPAVALVGIVAVAELSMG